MKKAIVPLNIVLFALNITFDIIYMIFGGILLKATASLMFTIMGVVNFCYIIKTKSSPYNKAVFLLIGVILACIADIVINYYFVPGAAIFAVAHICYITCCSYIIRFNIKDLILTVIVYVPCLLIMLLCPVLDYSGMIMQIVALIYAFILVLASCKAVMNFITNKTTLNLSLAIGNVLFFVSDVMLLFDVFSDISPVFVKLCLCTYYPAQCVLAFSMFLLAKGNSRKISKKSENH